MPDENLVAVGFDSPLLHRCQGIIALNLTKMHWDGKISSSVKHGKAEKRSAVYTVGVTVLLSLMQQGSNALRNACLSPVTSPCAFGQKWSNELWKKVLVYFVPCWQSYLVSDTNVSPVPVGQPSPENDNTIKDLLPEDAGIDHQTVHQLITVLMKFMAKDESSAESDISSAKAFNTVKRHLYVLLGYDQQEGCFMIAPQKMRVSTCFNAFIAGIAQVGEGTYYFLQLFLIACCWNGGSTAFFVPK